MKRRFRQLVRGGWYMAEVSRSKARDEWTDEYHYHIMRTWCHDNVDKGEWEGSIHSNHGNPKPGTKRFVFKHQEDKLLFTLRWGTTQ